MLIWPEETLSCDTDLPTWRHTGSNLLLDFHGDPVEAKLVVFSDGNHHMALQETLSLFSETYPEVKTIFWATTPPGPILTLLRYGALKVGNFVLKVRPHLFISPAHVLDKLVAKGYMQQHAPFVENRGSVLLVRKGNPKNISGVLDLVREDVRLFLSNPETESVSYQGYVDTLKGIAACDGIELSFIDDPSATDRIVYGTRIHHREAPQSLADGYADVAIVYYHLALRYVRIFPDLFEMIPLGGTTQAPRPLPENVISRTHIGLVGDGGPWGSELLRFLASPAIAKIYTCHGLKPI